MLILSRRRKERIVIGGQIEVVILHLGPEEVKIGITAPLEVPVHRGEVFDAIASQNRAATTSPSPDTDLLTTLRDRTRRSR